MYTNLDRINLSKTEFRRKVYKQFVKTKETVDFKLWSVRYVRFGHKKMQNSKNLSQKPEKFKENQQNPVFFKLYS